MLRARRIVLSCFTLALIASPLFGGQDEQTSPPPSNSDPASLSLSELQSQRDRLVAENQIRDEALRKELADATAETQRIKAQTELARAKVDQALADKNNAILKARTEMDEISASLALESSGQPVSVVVQ
jgi:hypothetical protein